MVPRAGFLALPSCHSKTRNEYLAITTVLQVRLAEQARRQHEPWPSSLGHQSRSWVTLAVDPLFQGFSHTTSCTGAVFTTRKAVLGGVVEESRLSCTVKLRLT